MRTPPSTQEGCKRPPSWEPPGAHLPGIAGSRGMCICTFPRCCLSASPQQGYPNVSCSTFPPGLRSLRLGKRCLPRLGRDTLLFSWLPMVLSIFSKIFPSVNCLFVYCIWWFPSRTDLQWFFIDFECESLAGKYLLPYLVCLFLAGSGAWESCFVLFFKYSEMHQS